MIISGLIGTYAKHAERPDQTRYKAILRLEHGKAMTRLRNDKQNQGKKGQAKQPHTKVTECSLPGLLNLRVATLHSKPRCLRRKPRRWVEVQFKNAGAHQLANYRFIPNTTQSSQPQHKINF